MRLAIFILLAAALPAQELPVMELSLRQAVDIALAPEGATRLQLAREAIRIAELRSRQARSALLPQLDGSYSYANQTRNLKAFGITFVVPIPGFSSPSFVGPFPVNDARVNLGQSVLDLASWKRYQVAKAVTDQTRVETSAVRQQAADGVARTYLMALRAQAHIDGQQANVDLAEALVKLAANQKDAGAGTGIDVTRARAQLANERQRLIAARNDFDRAVLLLLRAMNAPLASRVRLTDVLALVPVDTTGADAAIRAAQSARPDVKAQQQRERVARLQRQAVERERLPSLVAAADYGVIGPTFQDNAFPTRSIGVSLRVPLWDGGRREARRGETLVMQRQEAIRSRDLDRQVDLEIRLALDAIESARAQVDAATEGLALSENELAQARRRFEAGFASSLEVTDAQTRIARARDNRIGALYQFNLARLDLQTAMGQMP